MAVIVSFLITLIIAFSAPLTGLSQTVTHLDAKNLLPKASLFFSPRTGTFQEGANFSVGIFLDTKTVSMNAVEVRVNFPADKLTLIRPTGDKSIIGLWLEPPKYSNINGTAQFSGVIPGGIKTNNGLISTLSFVAKASGEAVVSISSNSRVLVNDGLGSDAILEYGRATYTVVPKPPEGATVFSDTHPSREAWYNNKNPVVIWNKDPGVTGFSYQIDTLPFTVPDNIVDTEATTASFADLNDGVWYFHIKAKKSDTWGSTTHFVIKIDTTMPANFAPSTKIFDDQHVLVSFYTTDLLSGIDHYEIGIIDKSQPAVESPVFVIAESPFQLPIVPKNATVIVRAIDRAGNARDVDTNLRVSLNSFIQKYSWIIWLISAFILLASILHFFFKHHLIAHINRLRGLWKKEEALEEKAAEAIHKDLNHLE